MTCFAAIDFETADNQRDSACSVAVVLVQSGKIINQTHHLIRPPRSYFLHTRVHGITWEDCCNEPHFGGIWPTIEQLLKKADFLVAHNAPFDRSVLEACCAAHKIRPPAKDFVCTLKIAREIWRLNPAKLPDVCQYLGIQLKHHDALSDAHACARIAIAAETAGCSLVDFAQ